MTNICLNMIVKDETHIVERVLKSVKDIITDYVILDTGSTDGTPEFIKGIMDNFGIPGAVYHDSWVNFAHGRNRALELAYEHSQSDYVLIIDADDELSYENINTFCNLKPEVDCYLIEKQHENIRYFVPFLMNIKRIKWKWHGAVHEYIESENKTNYSRINLDAAHIIYHSGGARTLGKTQHEKYMMDAALLEEELAGDPDNNRSRFYLAQSYRDAGEYELAIENYKKRAEMGGWEEEAFVAQLETARLMMLNNYPYEQFVPGFLRAYEMRPARIEPLFELTKYCRMNELYNQGYLFGKVAKDIPIPNDILFVNNYMYEYAIMDEFAICAYWAGKYQESYDSCIELLNNPKLPHSEKNRVEKNLEFAQSHLSNYANR